MTTSVSPWLIYAAATVVAGLGTRAWVSYRGNIRKRRAGGLPIVDPFALEVAFAPRKTSPDDDEAVLDDMKRIIAQANTQSRLLEFESCDVQVAEFYATLSRDRRPTAQRAVVRLIESGNYHLQMLGARIAAQLHLPDAKPPLRRLIDTLPDPNGTNQKRSSKLLDMLRMIGEP